MINPLKKVEVNHYTLHHPRVDERTRDLVIAHITDIHLGRWVKPHHVEDLAAYVNRHNVDLSVLTGDYVGYNKEDLDPCIKALDHLEGPAFATLGNHDHWASTELAAASFAATSLELLTNSSVPLETRRGHVLRVVGVDDAVTKHHDIEASFREAQDDLFRLTLCHVPSLAPLVAEAGADVIFSGHTHGLQFNLPGVARLVKKRLGMKYIGGSYQLEEALLYVSRGLGSASWPWRYRAAPELSFFTLAHGRRAQLTLDQRLQTSIAHVPSPRRLRKGPLMLPAPEPLPLNAPAPSRAEEDKESP